MLSPNQSAPTLQPQLNSESELKRRPQLCSAPSTFNVVKLSATDVLAPTTMKNAAKCDTSCDLQNPVNHQNFERILRFRDTPGSMLVGVSVDTTRPSPLLPSGSKDVRADSACSGARAPSAPNLVNETSFAFAAQSC